MTYRLLLIAFTFIFYTGLAQVKNVEIKVGKPYKLTKGQPRNYFYDGRYTIALKTSDRRVVTVQCFDTQTNTEVSKNIYTDLPEHEVQPPIESNGNFYYLYHFYNGKEKKQQLCSRRVNVAQGTLEPAVVICSTSPTVTILFEEDITPILPVHFKITKSFDSSKVLITYRVKPKSRNDDSNFDVWGYHVLDKDLKPLWNKEVQMPYVQTKMNKWSSAVTSQGKVYQLIYSNINKYELLLIKQDTIETHLLDLMPELRASEFHLNETKDGNVMCTCFYTSEILTSTGKDYRMAISSALDVKVYISDGLYFAEVSPDGKLIQEGKYEIPLDLLNAYEDEKTRTLNKEKESLGAAGQRDIKITNHLYTEDGGCIIIGEQQYYDLSAQFYDKYAHATIVYGQIYAIKLDAQGKLVWIKKLPKKQSSYYKIRGMGMKSFTLNGYVYIIYLDTPGSEFKENDVALEGQTLTVRKMNEETGEYRKYSLGGSNDIPGTTRMLFLMKRVAGNGERSTIEVEAGQDLETTVVFDLMN
ncbi:MAG: hypothetical protein H7282_09220 [Cytophagaceae bacterium]|nr:hypothetical protein [Cytophagaceae bacterium]